MPVTLSDSGTTERFEGVEITADQRLLLGPGPAFELGFAVAGEREGIEGFDSKQGDGRIERGCSAGLAGGVVFQPLVQIGCAANIKLTSAQAEDVNERPNRETGGLVARVCKQ